MKWIGTWYLRIMFVWYNRYWNTCDQCSGSFRQYDLLPTSGDWWLCPKCMDELLDEMNAEAKSRSDK